MQQQPSSLEELDFAAPSMEQALTWMLGSQSFTGKQLEL